MRAQPASPLGLLFMPAVTVLGLAAFWLSLSGSAVPAVAIAVIVVAIFVLFVSPTTALLLLAASRFSFDMAWRYKISGLGVLDFLGAGVPCGVLILLLLARPSRPSRSWPAGRC
jgi:NADH:ubiquinone oxidoreductase subunit 6 (subunit J)